MGVDSALDLVFGQQDVSHRPDVRDEPTSIDDVRWHRSLELTVTYEDDNCVNASGPEPGDFFDLLHMLVVLTQRILEPILLALQRLSPVTGSLVSEDASNQALRFDHEDAKLRNDDVIDLSAATRRR